MSISKKHYSRGVVVDLLLYGAWAILLVVIGACYLLRTPAENGEDATKVANFVEDEYKACTQPPILSKKVTLQECSVDILEKAYKVGGEGFKSKVSAKLYERIKKEES